MASKKPTDPIKAFASLKHHLKMPELPDPFKDLTKPFTDKLLDSMTPEQREQHGQTINSLFDDEDD